MKTWMRNDGVSPIVPEILMLALVLLCAIVAYLVIFQMPTITEVPPVAVQITKSG
jgi:FlaG/FlaF family flagellin (archaellin)